MLTTAHAVNLAVLGGIGTLAYQKWELPHWDRRIVSAVSVGLLTLFSGEGCVSSRLPILPYSRRPLRRIVAEKYSKPKH